MLNYQRVDGFFLTNLNQRSAQLSSATAVAHRPAAVASPPPAAPSRCTRPGFEQAEVMGHSAGVHISWNDTWWLIPLSKWFIAPVINGISRVNPLITGVITHLLSGMNHQVWNV